MVEECCMQERMRNVVNWIFSAQGVQCYEDWRLGACARSHMSSDRIKRSSAAFTLENYQDAGPGWLRGSGSWRENMDPFFDCWPTHICVLKSCARKCSSHSVDSQDERNIVQKEQDVIERVKWATRLCVHALIATCLRWPVARCEFWKEIVQRWQRQSRCKSPVSCPILCLPVT